MKVLLIKLTSMGDLTHALPALTDAARVYPDIEFHWVVDEAFAEIPTWHPKVTRVIKSAHRRWKKNKRQTWLQGELADFYRQLNAENYDAVIDAQTNLKSAFISLLRRGAVHGCDKKTAREYPAHWAYRYQHQVAKTQHAILRQRELLAKALDYLLPDSEPDYGISQCTFPKPVEKQLGFALPERYLIFVHNASWPTKLYIDAHWHSLIEHAEDMGYAVLLPCGNEQEKQRAEQLAANHSQAYALPKLSLNHTAALIQGAKAAICCDTGLAHIAAALGVPAITLYGSTDDQLIGTFGPNQIHMHASQAFACAPCYKKVCHFDGKHQQQASCMLAITPQQIAAQLDILLSNGKEDISDAHG